MLTNSSTFAWAICCTKPFGKFCVCHLDLPGIKKTPKVAVAAGFPVKDLEACLSCGSQHAFLFLFVDSICFRFQVMLKVHWWFGFVFCNSTILLADYPIIWNDPKHEKFSRSLVCKILQNLLHLLQLLVYFQYRCALFSQFGIHLGMCFTTAETPIHDGPKDASDELFGFVLDEERWRVWAFGVTSDR